MMIISLVKLTFAYTHMFHLLNKSFSTYSYRGGETSSEFGDFSVVQCLTGWIPEIIPLRYARQAHMTAG